MRTELPNAEKSGVLSVAVGQPVEVGLVNTHNASGGEDAYLRFKATAAFTPDYVAEIARSRYMRHFFDISEDEYVARWANV